MWQAFAHMLSANPSQGWDIARQVGLASATAGEPEANPDPASRSRWEDLAPIAAQRVAEVTGIDVTSANVDVLNRSAWVVRALDAYRPILEKIDLTASAASDSTEPGAGGGIGESIGGEDFDGLDAFAKAMEPLMKLLGPTLMAAQAGAVVGQLARAALGGYDVAAPWGEGAGVTVIEANVASFIDDWSLEANDARMWVLIEQFVSHAVLSRPHIQQELLELLQQRAATLRLDGAGLESQFGGIDMSDPGSISLSALEPSALLVRGSQPDSYPEKRLDSLLVALVGYIDYVRAGVAHRVLGAKAGALGEASRRRVVAATAADRLAALLLGVDNDRELHDRGARWVAGVVERGGLESLNRLWNSPRELPTPAEIEAPGLWLARIDLPDDTGSSAPESPADLDNPPSDSDDIAGS